MRRLYLVLVGVALMAGMSAPAAAASSAATPTPSCVLKITALSFHPRHVAPGGSSVLRVTARNCTHQAQQATLTWLGQFVGPTPGIPAGCPAIDPLAQPADFVPHGTVRASLGYVVFSSCTATSLSVTARLTGASGNPLAERTANLAIK
jgi:hypothetical protein